MNLLILCEGDAETSHGSFSGITNSLLVHLRAGGHHVETRDTDLYGFNRYLAAAGTVARPRARWSVKFRLGALPFDLRSRVAARHIARAGHLDAILQIGATFAPVGRGDTPYFLYCDSNIRMAERGAASGQSQAARLTQMELDAVIRRESSVYAGARGVFTLSERLRRSFIEDFGLAPDKVHTAHAGPNLDISEVPPRPEQRPPDQPPTIVFVGVRFERKGGDLLLRAFEKVRARIPNAQLIIIGPRTLDVSQPGVQNLGFLRKDDPAQWQELRRVYSTADVFCLPTRYEPFGIVFIEAMFFGLPCVGPDAWAIPEMVVDGETGFLVPPENVDILADRLIRILSDPALARRMGENGRRRAEGHFTWPLTAERITTQIKAALSLGRG